jgi:hypothetical protein
MIIPIVWNLFSRSLKNSLAKNTIMTISSGPAIRSSFEAPILVMESYQVNIPLERDTEAKIRCFHDLLKSTDSSFSFLYTKAATSKSTVPAKVMLMDASTIGENWRSEVVKYSMIIDSDAIAIA